jgi:DNA-binding transcriptional MerR regulator
MDKHTGLLSSDLVALSGVNQRTLDLWARTGLLVSSLHASAGTGDHRRYSERDALTARVLGLLRQSGLNVPLCRQAVKALAEASDEDLEWSSGQLLIWEGGACLTYGATRVPRDVSLLIHAVDLGWIAAEVRAKLEGRA